MKLEDLPDNAVIWTCGTHFPPEGFPGRENAEWGRCKTCGDEVVYNRQNDTHPTLKDAIKLCLECSLKLMESREEVPQITMTEGDKKIAEEAWGEGVAEKVMGAIQNRFSK